MQKYKMSSKEAGFTLVELIIVILIIGILAVIAVPKFIDLSSTSNSGAIKGIAAALSSASASNYAARKANAASGSNVSTCSDVGSLLQGSLPSGYSISPASTSITSNTTVTCTVINSAASVSATFNATGT